MCNYVKCFEATTVQIEDMDALHLAIQSSGSVENFGGLYLEGTTLHVIGDSLLDESALDLIIN